MSIDIRTVKDMNGLIAYLAEKLEWKIDLDDFEDIEDITYDFDAKDIGLKEEAFAKITSLRQLPPLVDGQKWGIFCVEFDSKRFEITALRKILSGLIPKRRNSAEHAVWKQKDLLFICFWGNDNERTIGLAHFEDEDAGLPQIKMISCCPAVEDFTQIGVFENRLKNLKWPANYLDHERWQSDWSSAFVTGYRQTIKDSSTLTVQLAAEAREIKKRILAILDIETSNGYVHLLYEKFKNTLIHDMTESQFADMYAQTVVYGLFSARCMDKTQDDFSAAEAIELIPNTNPFLKSLMKECLGSQNNSKLSFDELEIGNVVELLLHTKTDAIIQDFNRQTGGGREDPVIHFYEEFLTAYDKSQKVQRGVFYTPQPVVKFIVNAVDYIIKNEFGYEDGLASTDNKTIKYIRDSKRTVNGTRTKVEDTKEVPAIQILDPATGTGTFLRETILRIYENFKNKNRNLSPGELKRKWNVYVPEHLLPRINGFELMMAPYAVAHMKLAMVLKDTGYDFNYDERLRVYLTNTLEKPGNSNVQLALWDDPLASESIAANQVKKNKGINIIVGNPPYAGESSNKGDWILSLMESYKLEPGTNQKLKESNSKFINDDYVKFIRYAQETLVDSEGILCFINPHGYIDNPTFRGVRYDMLQNFDEVYILDLHGNTKKKEKTPEGKKDENVFDIQQGTCINVFIKKKNSKHECRVFHSDLFGLRKEKYNFLNNVSFESINWRSVPLSSPFFNFNYVKRNTEEEYNKGFSVRDLFQLGTLGVLTKRDSLVIGFSKDELIHKIHDFASTTKTTLEACSQFNIPVCDKDKWNAENARNLLTKTSDFDKYVINVHYRPFDIRQLFYHTNIIARPNTKVLQHIIGKENYALIICRQGGASNQETWDSVFIANIISDQNIYRRGGGTVFPLYIYEEQYGSIKKTPNFNNDILVSFEQSIEKKLYDVGFLPEDLLGYVYAVLFSNKYRNKYKEYMNKDFPRIPYPHDYKSFEQMSKYGKELISNHTNFSNFNNNDLDKYSFEGIGSNIVEKISYKNGKLYINKTQYFVEVKPSTNEFSIGGYAPLQKWLKDRKGLCLTRDDIHLFKKIISVIEKTITIVNTIDENFIE